jgi:branched-chain amino acid aminotransferase
VTSVWVDGKLSSEEEARISVFDRGLLYGESAFERMRAHDGQVLGLDLHLTSLALSCEELSIACDRDAIKAHVERALGGAPKDASVRLMVTGGEPARGAMGVVLVFVEAAVPPPREAYASGVSAVIVDVDHSPRTPLGTRKWGGYASHLVLRARAEALGAHEALVTNAAGEVIEGATSNVFAVVDDTLWTPPDASGPRPGVTRHFVLECARRRGIAIEMRPLDRRTLASAREVFITSSVREVLPVASIDREPVGQGSFVVARMLHADLRAQKGVTDPLPWL